MSLVECGLREDVALRELETTAHDFSSWLAAFTSPSGVPLNAAGGPSASASSTVRLSKVLATEEMMWSVQWGIKGATDASIEVEFPAASTPTNSFPLPPWASSASPSPPATVVPLELKTGNKTYSRIQHQGQLILYTLLLNERYQHHQHHQHHQHQQSTLSSQGKTGCCRDGLLVYSAGGVETNRIEAFAAHIRGLILARNKFASYLAKIKSSAGSGSVLPPMLRNKRDCGRCFQAAECILVHAAVENGSQETSGLDDLFLAKTGHLRAADLQYFKHWMALIELEQQQPRLRMHPARDLARVAALAGAVFRDHARHAVIHLVGDLDADGVLHQHVHKEEFEIVPRRIPERLRP